MPQYTDFILFFEMMFGANMAPPQSYSASGAWAISESAAIKP